MLGTLTNKLPDDALERLADPTALWTDGWLERESGARCYLGHAMDWRMNFSHDAATDEIVGGAPFMVGVHFDALCHRFGVDRVSRACRLRAERVLSSRGLVPQEHNPKEEAYATRT